MRLAAAARAWVDSPARLAALLLLVAVAARAAQFGNPVVQVDDEFYLLTGDRMLHGALPYVDIWDRKPIGLFLIYAGIRLLGGAGVLQYQIVATLFAVATALVVARIARNLSGPHGAAAAGGVYILYLGIFGGEGGQSPVFYNLFVALAAWTMIGLVRRPGFGTLAFGGGMVAMLLIGVAMQVKYTALFEGLFFGLALLWLGFKRGTGRGTLAAMALAWIGAALLPTLAAWAWYAAIGHGDAFVQANFLSILDRGSDGLGIALKRLAGMVFCLVPLALAAWLGRGMARPVSDDVRRLLDGWAIAAIAGVLLFGTYFDHYALPLIAPLCVLAAAWFGDGAAGLVLVSGRTRWRVPVRLAPDRQRQSARARLGAAGGAHGRFHPPAASRLPLCVRRGAGALSPDRQLPAHALALSEPPDPYPRIARDRRRAHGRSRADHGEAARIRRRQHAARS